MSKNSFKIFSFCLLLVFLLTIKSHTQTLINLTIAKENVIKYHESGRYDKDLDRIIQTAKLKFNSVHVKKNSAVVFDVDETSLSNYNFDKSIDFGSIKGVWDKWTDSAKAPAIPQVKSLYDFLIKKGIKIIFLTGRPNYQYNATLKNLREQGYTTFDTLITRSPSEYHKTAVKYKSYERTELTKKGYNIVGDVGDQESDLVGPYHGIKVKIPNYQYLIR
jgi:acid phosphatase